MDTERILLSLTSSFFFRGEGDTDALFHKFTEDVCILCSVVAHCLTLDPQRVGFVQVTHPGAGQEQKSEGYFCAAC